MSNYNTNLQSNNIDLQTVIQTLQTKATPSSEDVTDETNAYTEKIEQLTNAITALEEELAGKASGSTDGGSGINVDTCTLTINYSNPGPYSTHSEHMISYYTLENNKICPNVVAKNEVRNYSISNIVIGSIITIYNSSPQYNYIPQLGCQYPDIDTSQLRPMQYILITADKGQEAIIDCIYNDF
jgi:hypothetical protein